MSGIVHENPLLGVKVVVSQYLNPKPKLCLSQAFPGSDLFRLRFNKWLAERFGYEQERFIVSGDTVFVSQRTYDKMKEELPHL